MIYPARTGWWEDYRNLVILITYLAENDWSATEVTRAVEKPWAYQDEYLAAMVEHEAQCIVDTTDRTQS